MKEEIKTIYTRLSGGKVINDDADVISEGQFSSVLLDRFMAELKKLGVQWDRRDIAFGELLAGHVNGEVVERRIVEKAPLNGGAAASKTGGLSIGIDIQDVAELPDCVDYWEDEFYKMKFAPEEIAYGVSRKDPKETFAGIYSCKEALVKCDNTLEWSSIVISHDANGGPQFADYCLSISHSGGNAIAVAVQYKADVRQVPNENADRPRISPPSIKPSSSKATKFLFVLLAVVILYLVYRDFIR